MASTRRDFLARLGIGTSVALLDGGGRALAAPGASTPSASPPLPPTADPQHLSSFGRMFPALPALRPDNDPKVTLANIGRLAATMPESVDPSINGPDDPKFDITGLGSARTYFGQFIDHDLTLDLQPQPADFIDPLTLKNFETFRFDLSSVYGGGPTVSPQLYEADLKHFRVVEANANGVRDLPRDATGKAILVEGRNDENEIIGQVHTAFLKFHNKIVGLGYDFDDAHRLTIHHYQWAILHDFLPGWVGQDVVSGVLNGSIQRFYHPVDADSPMTPVEWSVAAYRFGHSVVRDDYELNDTDSSHNIFDGTDNDLHGGRPLPAGRQIDWGDFEVPLQTAANTAAGNTQAPRLIDTHVSNGLFLLPIGGQSGAEVSGLQSLPQRNMIRGFFYGLPSGQAIARRMGVPVIHPNDAINPTAVPGFDGGTPAWYYMLKEAELQGGQRLGTVGGRIVTDVFAGLLQSDPHAILNPNVSFIPRPPIAPSTGTFGIADLLVFAGVAVRP